MLTSSGPPPGDLAQASSSSAPTLHQPSDELLQDRVVQAQTASAQTQPDISRLNHRLHDPSYTGNRPAVTCMSCSQHCDRVQPRCKRCRKRFMDCLYAAHKPPPCESCKNGDHCNRQLPCSLCTSRSIACRYRQGASRCDQCPLDDMCSRVAPCYRCQILGWECTHTGEAIPRCIMCPDDKVCSRYRPTCHRCQDNGLICIYP